MYPDAVGRGGVGGIAANPAPTNSKRYESLVILSEARNLIKVYRTVVLFFIKP
jgi:hypothetical protein